MYRLDVKFACQHFALADFSPDCNTQCVDYQLILVIVGDKDRTPCSVALVCDVCIGSAAIDRKIMSRSSI